MLVRTASGKKESIDIEEGSIHTIGEGWITAFAMHSHDDEDNVPHFDIYHLTTIELAQSPEIFNLAISEVEEMADDIAYNFDKHPYRKVLTSALGLAGGAYAAGQEAWEVLHPKGVRKAILKGGAKGAISGLILPGLLFQTAKHTAHLVQRLSQGNQKKDLNYIYVRTNELGGPWYDDAPWRT